MAAKCIMLQGTASHVGKSILAAGLCRLFVQEGFRVAPFKSQNITLNSYLTAKGKKIGIAQGLQAEAAGIKPAVEMNPLLLQLKKGMAAKVIVMGRPLGEMGGWEYRENYYRQGLTVIKKALQKLRSENEILVIEGAGSPAEVNLKEKDLANMKVASLADAPVVLIADIDKGGAFAALVGTLELLGPGEKERVAGFIINKFRGERRLLRPAIDFLEERTGRPVLGVTPFLDNLEIDEEDSRFSFLSTKSMEEEKEAAVRRRNREASYDRLAAMLRTELNLKRLYTIMGL